MNSLAPMPTKLIRRIAYPLLVAIGGVGLAAHAWWFHATGDVVVVQRAGSWLTVWGIAVTARPIFLGGVADAVQRQLPVIRAMVPHSSESIAEQRRKIEARRPEIWRSVVAERVTGVLMIVCGTLLNGYGDIVGRWLIKL